MCYGFRPKKGEIFCRSGPDRNGKRKRVRVWPEKGTKKKKRRRRRKVKENDRDIALARADQRHCETHDLGKLFHRHVPTPTAWQICARPFCMLNHTLRASERMHFCGIDALWSPRQAANSIPSFMAIWCPFMPWHSLRDTGVYYIRRRRIVNVQIAREQVAVRARLKKAHGRYGVVRAR